MNKCASCKKEIEAPAGNLCEKCVKQVRRVCYPCHRSHNRKNYITHNEQAKRRAHRANNKPAYKLWKFKWQLKNRYGLEHETYLELLSSQGGGCAICGSIKTANKMSLAVDHCHKSGRIRGILCDSCNVGISRFKDDPSKLLAAIEYLKNPPAICLAALKAVGE